MASPQESEKKVRKLAQKDPPKGKELEMLQEGQVELQNIQAQQQALLQEESMAAKAQDQQLQQMASLGEMGILSDSGDQQSPVVQQVAQMNPATQATLGKYGLKQGAPKTTQSQTRSVKVSPNKVIVNNTTYTTTHNDVKVSQPSMGAPVIRQAPVQKSGNSAVTKFKTWMSNAFARQREENAVREKEYRRKEWSLSRSASRMMRGLEKLGKTIGDRLDPRKLNASRVSSLQMLSWLMTIGTITKFWPQIVKGVGNVVEWLMKVGEYFGVVKEGGTIKWSWGKSKMREGILNLLGARGSEDVPTALKKFFWNSDRNDGLGIFNYFIEKLKEWFSEIGDRINNAEVPHFDKTNNTLLDGILGGIESLMKFGKDALVAMFTDRSFSSLRAARTVEQELTESVTEEKPLDSYGAAHGDAPSGIKHTNAKWYNDEEEEETYYRAEDGKIYKSTYRPISSSNPGRLVGQSEERDSAIGLGDKAVLEYSGEDRPDSLLPTDVWNERLQDSLGASARQSSVIADRMSDPNDIYLFIQGMRRLLERSGYDDNGVLVVEDFIKNLKRTFNIDTDKYFNSLPIKYVKVAQNPENKYDWFKKHNFLNSGPFSALDALLRGNAANNLAFKQKAWVAVPGDYQGDDVETDAEGNEIIRNKYFITKNNLVSLANEIFDKIGLTSAEDQRWDLQNTDLRARLKEYLYSLTDNYQNFFTQNLQTVKDRLNQSNTYEAYYKDKYDVDNDELYYKEGDYEEYKKYYPTATEAAFNSRIGTLAKERLDTKPILPGTVKPKSGLTYTYDRRILSGLGLGPENNLARDYEYQQYLDYLANSVDLNDPNPSLTYNTGKTVDLGNSDFENSISPKAYTISRIKDDTKNYSDSLSILAQDELEKLQAEEASGSVVSSSNRNESSVDYSMTRASQGWDNVTGGGNRIELADVSGEVEFPQSWSDNQRYHATIAWNMAKYFHEQNPNVDPRIVFGMMMHETGVFTTNQAKNFNYGGWKVSSSPRHEGDGYSLWDDPETAKISAYRNFYAPGTRQDSEGWSVMKSDVSILGNTLGPSGSYYFGGDPNTYQSGVIKHMKSVGFIKNDQSNLGSLSSYSPSANLSSKKREEDNEEKGGFLSSATNILGDYVKNFFQGIQNGLDYLIDLENDYREQKDGWQEVPDQLKKIAELNKRTDKDLWSMVDMTSEGNLAKEMTALDPEHEYNIQYSDSEPGKFTLYWKEKKGKIKDKSSAPIKESKEEGEEVSSGTLENIDRGKKENIDDDGWGRISEKDYDDAIYKYGGGRNLCTFDDNFNSDELSKLDPNFDYKVEYGEDNNGNTERLYFRRPKNFEQETHVENNIKEEDTQLEYSDTNEPETTVPEDSEWMYMSSEFLSKVISGIINTANVPREDKEKLESGNYPEIAEILSKYDPGYEYSYEIVKEGGKNKYKLKRKQKPPQEVIDIKEELGKFNDGIAQSISDLTGFKMNPDKIKSVGNSFGSDTPDTVSLAQNIIDGNDPNTKLEDVTKAGYVKISDGLFSVKNKLGDFLIYAAQTGNTIINQNITQNGGPTVTNSIT